ncbi:hypothetical protein BLNAU_12970 [Blattamonas nauphoetae]|uniref:Uncharacterized protein n=1 Tax=Blattamonas nauphoetae TaxID=2049346 RepID=A0ABQ9XMT1_9EUKA|nr:hypothetical protein BLNAU_12970 [Blattamonas nauphoetae]
MLVATSIDLPLTNHRDVKQRRSNSSSHNKAVTNVSRNQGKASTSSECYQLRFNPPPLPSSIPPTHFAVIHAQHQQTQQPPKQNQFQLPPLVNSANNPTMVGHSPVDTFGNQKNFIVPRKQTQSKQQNLSASQYIPRTSMRPKQLTAKGRGSGRQLRASSDFGMYSNSTKSRRFNFASSTSPLPPVATLLTADGKKQFSLSAKAPHSESYGRYTDTITLAKEIHNKETAIIPMQPLAHIPPSPKDRPISKPPTTPLETNKSQDEPTKSKSPPITAPKTFPQEGQQISTSIALSATVSIDLDQPLPTNDTSLNSTSPKPPPKQSVVVAESIVLPNDLFSSTLQRPPSQPQEKHDTPPSQTKSPSPDPPHASPQLTSPIEEFPSEGNQLLQSIYISPTVLISPNSLPPTIGQNTSLSPHPTPPPPKQSVVISDPIILSLTSSPSPPPPTTPQLTRTQSFDTMKVSPQQPTMSKSNTVSDLHAIRKEQNPGRIMLAIAEEGEYDEDTDEHMQLVMQRVREKKERERLGLPPIKYDIAPKPKPKEIPTPAKNFAGWMQRAQQNSKKLHFDSRGYATQPGFVTNEIELEYNLSMDDNSIDDDVLDGENLEPSESDHQASSDMIDF